MTKKFIYLIIILTLVNLTALATMIYQRWMNPEKSPCKPMQEVRFEQIKRELALTPAQTARFEKIRHDFHSRIDSLNLILEGQNQALLQEIWQSQTNDARIDSLLNRISQLQMKSKHLVIWHFYQFKEVLTPDQWQKFYSIVAERFPGRFKNSGFPRQLQTEKDN